MKEFIDVITLTGAHSLVMSHKYDKVPKEDLVVVQNQGMDIGKFGLFNITSPNLNTYYPDIKPEDIRPEDADFIYPVFRLLSKNVLNKFGPIDFSDGNVLKDSMKALVGQTVYTEHEDLIGNHIGTVSDVFWQEEYKQDGVTIPAGINGILKLDAKSNPKIARGILMEPPAIHSASVSVFYSWKKSHDMETDEFYEKMGTFDSEGNLVRKIATKIILYTELSLVPHGADPFAQLQKNGKINNPDFAKKFHDLAVNGKFSYQDYKRIPQGDLEVEISSFNYHSNPKNLKNEKSMKDLLVKLSKKVGFEVKDDQEVKADELLSFIEQKLSDNLKNEQDYAKEISTLKTQNQELDGKLAKAQENLKEYNEKKDFIQIGENSLTTLRQETLAMYTSLKGDEKDDNIVSLIENSNFQVAESLLKQYKSELEKLSPLACSKCGGTEITRASSQREDGEGGEGKQTVTFKPNHEVIENRRKARFSTSRIHG